MHTKWDPGRAGMGGCVGGSVGWRRKEEGGEGGSIERWRDRGMEGWRDGGIEGWRDGGLEG